MNTCPTVQEIMLNMPQNNTVIIANVYCLLYKLNALPLFS